MLAQSQCMIKTNKTTISQCYKYLSSCFDKNPNFWAHPFIKDPSGCRVNRVISKTTPAYAFNKLVIKFLKLKYFLNRWYYFQITALRPCSIGTGIQVNEASPNAYRWFEYRTVIFSIKKVHFETMPELEKKSNIPRHAPGAIETNWHRILSIGKTQSAGNLVLHLSVF